jgi:hypothetical protein
MPTVVRKDGFSIHVFAPPREHPPPHVHVYKAEGHAVIAIGTATGELISLHVYQMSPGDLAHALQLVRQHQVLLVEVWRKLHGERSD